MFLNGKTFCQTKSGERFPMRNHVYDPSMDQTQVLPEPGRPATQERLNSQPLSHHLTAIGTFFRRDKGGRGDVDDIGSHFFSASYWVTIKGEFSQFVKGIIKGVYKRCFRRLTNVKERCLELETLVDDQSITAEEFRKRARPLLLGEL